MSQFTSKKNSDDIVPFFSVTSMFIALIKNNANRAIYTFSVLFYLSKVICIYVLDNFISKCSVVIFNHEF